MYTNFLGLISPDSLVQFEILLEDELPIVGDGFVIKNEAWTSWSNI